LQDGDRACRAHASCCRGLNLCLPAPAAGGFRYKEAARMRPMGAGEAEASGEKATACTAERAPASGAGGAAAGAEHAGGTAPPSPLLAEFVSTRKRTLMLVEPLEPDDYTVQTAPYTSPPKWHMGHVSWMFEVVLGKLDPSYEPHRAGLSEYLNSYYQQFGEPMAKASRGVVSRPTVEEVRRYYAAVTERVAAVISSGRCGGGGGEYERMIRLGIHHECQHQELLVYDLQHMLASEYRPRGGLAEAAGAAAPGQGGADGAGAMVRVDGGLYRMGSAGADGRFCYDIEMPEHAVHMEDYGIGVVPVTCGEYMRFVEDGGYGSYRHWLADGWEKVKENGWEAPMYWEKAGGGRSWQISDFAGRQRPVDPREPVRNVSFYEADAYCRWAGKRLPTEAEWEKAALWDAASGRKLRFPWGDSDPAPDRANLLESGLWRCSPAGSYPAGKSPAGCHQMIGDVWEWTSSEFVGYPGFRTGFDEYNDKWFTCQKVLRGGSFGTPSMSIRGTYRNFFRLDERWMFAGFRCAADA